VNAYSRIAAALLAVALGFEVVQAATVSSSSSSTRTESRAARLEREVALPLRERHLGWDVFSRAGPRWDASQLRLVVDAAPAIEGWTAFRLEAPSLRGRREPEVAWSGRANARTGAVELARGAGAPSWRPLADVLADHRGLRLPR
jgi:hypothetical protein